MKKLRTASLKYDRAIVSQLVLDGMELRRLSTNKACIAAGLPLSTFIDWTNDDKELAARYAHARERLLEGIAEEIMEIADDELPVDIYGKIDNGAVQKQKLRIDTRKWLLSKLAPKKYGDKVEVDHTGTVKIDAITRKVVDPSNPLIIDQTLNERVIKAVTDDSEDPEDLT